MTSASPSPTRSVRLSRAEAWDVIATAHTGILTTLRADGTPMSLPTWFVVDGGEILSRALARSGRVRRIRRNSRASFLVESGLAWAELRAVHLCGDVIIDDDPDHLAAVARRLDEKYAGFVTEAASMPESTRRHYRADRVVLRFVPDERIISWDNSRLVP